MKTLLYILLCGSLLAGSACSSKKDDPAPPTTPQATNAPTAHTTVTNGASALTTTSLGVNAFADVSAADGSKVSIAVIDVNFPGDQYGPYVAQVKYYLTSTTPIGTIRRIDAHPFNSAAFNTVTATGTLTGRTLSVNGVTHLYLSGSFQPINLGPGYTAVAATFTDLQAY